MAYDEELAERIRELVQTEEGVSERTMFGGLAFLVNGNLAVSASGQGGLLLRVDPAESEPLLEEPHVEPFVMRGRSMSGWLRVGEEGLKADNRLERWVALGLSYARTLPPKLTPNA
jgi:TfoX/Sxy family transcriptional regulator of competence genes